MASRFNESSSMKISSKLWRISSATVIFSPLLLAFLSKILRRTGNGLYETATGITTTLRLRSAKGGDGSKSLRDIPWQTESLHVNRQMLACSRQGAAAPRDRPHPSHPHVQ